MICPATGASHCADFRPGHPCCNCGRQVRAERRRATREAPPIRAVASEEEARKASLKVYRRLLAQGRPEQDARRDAERWVKGNLGVEVSIRPKCKRCGRPALTGKGMCQSCLDERFHANVRDPFAESLRQAAEATRGFGRESRRTSDLLASLLRDIEDAKGGGP